MIFKNSVLIAFFSVLSILLAIVRDRLLAGYVGVGPLLDIYNASFRIPDLMYGMVLAFVTSGTVVPFLTKEDKHGNIVDPRAKLASLTMFFVAMLGVLSTVIAITLPLFAHYIVPGFTEDQMSIFITTTRILLIQPILLGATSLISCLAQMKNQFFLYGISPLGYSIGIIAGIVFMYPTYGVFGLTYGVIIGSLLSLAIQAFSLRGFQFRRSFSKASFHHVYELIKVAFPRTGTNVITQVRTLFFHGFATTLGPGVLSAFLFAQKITDAVVQVVQQSVTTASLPILSKEVVDRNINDYKHIVKRYVSVLGGLGIAAAVVLYILQDFVIRFLYGDTGSNHLIAFFLTGFLIALPFQMMSGYYVVGLYSAHDTKDVFTAYLLSSFISIGTIILLQTSGAQSLVIGYVVFWVVNFLIILSLYSRKKVGV